MAHIVFLSLFFFSLVYQQVPKFKEQLIDGQVSIGYGLATGDVDGDGKPDILLADKKHFVWYRNGDWRRFVLAENLTEADNVCIAARDIDGDGKVEVAVGAQWNPSETSDTVKSGAVFYLVRPSDPTQPWNSVRLHHEPVTHRMRWARAGDKYHLVVLPLHGRGNKGGEGDGVKVFAYEPPSNPEREPWKLSLVDDSMHLTHNLDVVSQGHRDILYIGGKEGIKAFTFKNDRWTLLDGSPWVIEERSFGELRAAGVNDLITGIEPMHGNQLTVYSRRGRSASSDAPVRTVITSDLNQGHALAIDDLLRAGRKQIVVGWREPNKEGKVGIKMFVQDRDGAVWKAHWIDNNGMACEDLQVADLNGDGLLDVIAAGRATGNLKVYWNQLNKLTKDN